MVLVCPVSPQTQNMDLLVGSAFCLTVTQKMHINNGVTIQ